MIDNSVHNIPIGSCEKAKPVKPGSHDLHNYQHLTVNAENFQASSDLTLGSIQSGHELNGSNIAEIWNSTCILITILITFSYTLHKEVRLWLYNSWQVHNNNILYIIYVVAFVAN